MQANCKYHGRTKNNEYNKICQSFILEKNIGTRINQLQFFKEIGCETYDEIHQFLNERKKLNTNKKKNNSDTNDKSETKKLRDRNNLKLNDDKKENKSSKNDGKEKK